MPTLNTGIWDRKSSSPYENKINVSKVNNIVLSEYGNRGHAIMNLIQKPKKKKSHSISRAHRQHDEKK